MRASVFTAPLWSSAFRPFYLLGTLYAPPLALGAALAWLGVVGLDTAGLSPALWHGHEMLFGFAGAIVSGTLLTALPSWAQLAETEGRRLAALVACWVLGRLAFWASPWLAQPLVALADAALPVALLVALWRPVWRAREPLYRLLLPVLALWLASNMAFHVAWALHGERAAAAALHGALWSLALLFSLKGGVLIPVFTANARRELGDESPVPAVPLAAQVALTGSLLAAGVLDVAQAPPAWTGTAAAAAAALQAWRWWRWRGWTVWRAPLVAGLHAGFAWFVLALALKAASCFGAPWPASAWVHAFTLGAVGSMMLSLMTRVGLRHTGRPMAVPASLRFAGPAMSAAALLRVAAVIAGLGTWALALSLALWAACFAAYAARFGAMLWRPSVPRD